jgi:hypothetical protein
MPIGIGQCLEDDMGWCRLISLPAACFKHASA